MRQRSLRYYFTHAEFRIANSSYFTYRLGIHFNTIPIPGRRTRKNINYLKGDVVEVNYMDTTLWELGGDYLSNDVPSGKLIRFPNSLIFQSAVFNYSWEKFPYLWNEVSIYIAYDSDLEKIEKIMKDITIEELGAELNEGVRHFKDIVKDTSVNEEYISENPFVSFDIKEEAWIKATVTYPVELNHSINIRNRLIKKILNELKKVEPPVWVK